MVLKHDPDLVNEIEENIFFLDGKRVPLRHGEHRQVPFQLLQVEDFFIYALLI